MKKQHLRSATKSSDLRTLATFYLVPARVVFKRYATAELLEAAFQGAVMRDAGVPKKEWKDWIDPQAMAWKKAINRAGFWGFADGKKTVSYWASKDVPKWKLFYLLGHEVGHLVHKKCKGIKEELRADSYGAAASAVWVHLKHSARLLGDE